MRLNRDARGICGTFLVHFVVSFSGRDKHEAEKVFPLTFLHKNINLYHAHNFFSTIQFLFSKIDKEKLPCNNKQLHTFKKGYNL